MSTDDLPYAPAPEAAIAAALKDLPEVTAAIVADDRRAEFDVDRLYHLLRQHHADAAALRAIHRAVNDLGWYTADERHVPEPLFTNLLTGETAADEGRTHMFLRATDKLWQTRQAKPSRVTADGGRRGPNANARMIDMLGKRPDSKQWTAKQWAEALGYRSQATIKETDAWKGLAQLRAAVRAERRLAAANSRR